MGTGVPSSLLPPVRLHIQAVSLDTPYSNRLALSCQAFLRAIFRQFSARAGFPVGAEFPIARGAGRRFNPLPAPRAIRDSTPGLAYPGNPFICRSRRVGAVFAAPRPRFLRWAPRSQLT